MKHDKDKAEKQQRRAAEARALSQNIRALTIGFKALFEDQLREQGLTLPQLRLLKSVDELADVSAAELARTCQVTPQTLQAMLTRAVQAKWITRGKSSRNERFVTASLTPLGKQLLEMGKEKAATLEAAVWQDAGISEMRAMNDRLRDCLNRLAEAGG